MHNELDLIRPHACSYMCVHTHVHARTHTHTHAHTHITKGIHMCICTWTVQWAFTNTYLDDIMMNKKHKAIATQCT